MNCEKPWITSPAAFVPVWPWPIISLVEEIFKESRSIKDASKIVGKAEKSKGRSIKSVIVKMRIARANETARPKSKIQAGTGSTIITMMTISAAAKKMVGLKWMLIR